jgi:hypothetical protein
LAVVTAKLVRLFADDDGETHLASLDLPGPEVAYEDGDPPSLAVRDIPATTVHVTRLLEWRPRLELHAPPRRQLVVLLQGGLEITTTGGDCQRLQPGDCLLAEDLDSEGHVTDDVGDERLMTLSIGLVPEWRWPGTNEKESST